METLSEFFNSFIQKVANFLMNVLPKSPFRTYLSGYEYGSGLLKAVNYIVPIPVFISITSVWVTAMILYYIYHGLSMHVFGSNQKENRKYIGTVLKTILKIFKK